MAVNPNVIVLVPGVFDLHSYIPNAVQLVFYYLVHDPDLHKTIGRHFSIPRTVTKHFQVMNMTGVGVLPVTPTEPNRLAYAAHVYPFYYLGSQFSWDQTNPSYESFKYTLNQNWGYLSLSEQAPVWVGEMGTDHNSRGVGSAWSNYTVRYLQEMDLDFAYWILGDARNEVDPVTGVFSEGADDYAMLDHSFRHVLYPPLLASLKPLMDGWAHKKDLSVEGAPVEQVTVEPVEPVAVEQAVEFTDSITASRFRMQDDGDDE